VAINACIGADGIIVRIDTHKDEHVVVAIDGLGARVGGYRAATTAKGYAGLEDWACSLGLIRAFGREGTGSYGAGLARFLASRGHRVNAQGC
jgi:transposase